MSETPDAPVTIVHDSPLGTLHVGLLRRLVGRGEPVEVTPAQAERLLQQAMWSTYSATTPSRPDENAKKTEWAAFAEYLGLDVPASATKPDLIEAVDAALAAAATIPDPAIAGPDNKE